MKTIRLSKFQIGVMKSRGEDIERLAKKLLVQAMLEEDAFLDRIKVDVKDGGDYVEYMIKKIEDPQ